MSTTQIRTLVLWLSGAVTALALSAVWVLGAGDGKVSAWALVPFMWSVALGAGFVHHLREFGLLAHLRLYTERIEEPGVGAHVPT
jgi:hypothetical protein